MTFKQFLVATAALVAASAASAQGYVTLSGGPTRINLDCAGTTACDNNGTGFKLMGGYKFSKELAVEVG